VTGVQTCALPIYEIKGVLQNRKCRHANHTVSRKRSFMQAYSGAV